MGQDTVQTARFCSTGWTFTGGWMDSLSQFFFSSADLPGVTFLGTTLFLFCFCYWGFNSGHHEVNICLLEVEERYLCGVEELQRFIRSIAVIEIVIFVCWRIDFSPSSSI